ncbi:bifunctional DNA-binding transcriptional regulator/O6-methylguanine-DNA methyltransferase Ada [Halomonas sp. I1]|uniref:bifunctional DNA-binding transcriptional regulator/O6-methylguanine-DNA methyltransferase Ada n=1 Tax=Halomonas sp. I1 TaxID=393536 RepID=UPI0028DEA2EE|nr:bifunctional DNA-binding transcriptional regulator/O6-methylguanine-DNA methyltransferase Ada [Halomonas sp. I1]MDT8896450.1 bifunctional DNA-binding transcriptional regulator/O6-methylguanine-DNA methyltransferase Ada [Halomonas sp. I1]
MTLTMATQRPIDTERDRRWQAVLQRDASADGSFVYAVLTTGVYCRPSCPSRRAKPENVSFHDSPQDAEAAGYRPCKRCAPNAPSADTPIAALVERACRIIEQADEPLGLLELAERVGLSPSYLHHRFKAVTGLTPKAYARAHQARRVREALNTPDGDVTRAIHGAGFRSSGRFYENADAMLGMTPTAYKGGGRDTTIRFAVGECSLGSVLVACSTRGVCAILLGDAPAPLVRDLQDRFPRAELTAGGDDFKDWIARVVGLIDDPALGTELPLDIRGTAFQQRVWQALREIPAGSTASYTKIAERIGSPAAVRAVARACAANPLAVAIPCHRVVRRDGDLSGYRWGIERKRTLLDREVDHPRDHDGEDVSK